MKKVLYLLLLVGISALGQPTAPPPPAAGIPIPTRPLNRPVPGVADESSKLTKFNLDFPGGTPAQLVAAIEKATARPLNVVIPDEYASENIPALRMTQVTVADLFRAMESASIKTEPYRTGSYYGGGQQGQSYSYQQIKTSISFQTSGPVSDDSIWYFRGREKVPDLSAWDTKPAPVRICRFYSLNPYLEGGMKVEDITTAIQTGWKMLGEKETPTISFHKETKLLIAVGDPGKLEMIDSVLSALRPAPPSFIEQLEGRRRQVTEPTLPLKPNLSAPKPAPTPETEP